MDNWLENEKELEKEFEFSNFLEAVEFINKIAPIAESMDHHPDLFLHSYKKLLITLSTHSEGKVTKKDYELAAKIDKMFIE